jgi:hypothetical protein
VDVVCGQLSNYQRSDILKAVEYLSDEVRITVLPFPSLSFASLLRRFCLPFASLSASRFVNLP